MKKVLFALFLILLSFSLVKAESYYVNDNGVELSKDEYDFITNMYYEGYQKFVTAESISKIRELGLVSQPIEKIKTPDYMPIINVYEKGRTMTLSKSCLKDECMVTIVVNWAGTPVTTSYDVIGTLVDNTNITLYGMAVVQGKNYDKTYSSPKKFDNGFGYSVLIPDTTNITVSTSYYAKKSGRVFASYQHAMRQISEANSKLYTLSILGYGNVFDFYGTAADVYDQATGLDFALNS